MIEKWLQITCDNEDCGNTENSTWPNMTIVEFREELRQFGGWGRRKGKDFCGTCLQEMDSQKSR